MKLETFFEKFDPFADAPDAVAKLRELVLHLAVQGRLVSNCRENPLSAEQIASEKQRRLRELNIRSHPETPQPIANDIPFSLPESWHAVALGDLAFSCPTSYGEDPIPPLPKAGVVKVGNIANPGGFKGHFSERGFRPDEIESLLARRGDLMVVKSSGSAENVHSGKTALCTAEHDGKIVGTNFVLRLRLIGAPALPEYVWRVLTSRYSRAWIAGMVQTMTYPNLKWSDFARLPIPLPPLAEQKRIVAKVDELMALCDRLEAQQQARETRHAALARASLARFADEPTPANLDFLFHNSYDIAPADLRKSILTLAVQGKLVPQDPNDEPAAKLLAQITRKKQAMIEAKQVRPGKVSRPHGALDAPTELPSGWEWVKVDSLCYKVTDGTHFTPQYADSGVRFVSAKDIVSGKLVFGRCKFITREEHEQLYRRCNPEYHDIVISKSGSIGTVALVEDRNEFSLFESLALLKFDQGSLFPAFLVFALTHACASLTTGHIRGVGVKHLHLDILRGLELALPPLAEQRRIVAKVEQLLALVDALETQLAASRATAANLLTALVAELTTPR